MIGTVFNVASKAMLITPSHVTINWDKVYELAKQMESDGSNDFYEKSDGYKMDINNDILKELVASSINYCYWYGASDLRPNDVSSSVMYECVNIAFSINDLSLEEKIRYLIEMLTEKRFPLLDERRKHLLEFCNGQVSTEAFVQYVRQKVASIDLLCKYFPGFASDIFLKRASLFFIQIYRKYGWYGDLRLPVPADYQVPKILRYFGCIEYKPNLEEDIYENKLIPKGSIQEIQIRSATILVCDELRRKLDWPIADVDTYLWTKRKLTDIPFHLTITTDY